MTNKKSSLTFSLIVRETIYYLTRPLESFSRYYFPLLIGSFLFYLSLAAFPVVFLSIGAWFHSYGLSLIAAPFYGLSTGISFFEKMLDVLISGDRILSVLLNYIAVFGGVASFVISGISNTFNSYEELVDIRENYKDVKAVLDFIEDSSQSNAEKLNSRLLTLIEREDAESLIDILNILPANSLDFFYESYNKDGDKESLLLSLIRLSTSYIQPSFVNESQFYSCIKSDTSLLQFLKDSFALLSNRSNEETINKLNADVARVCNGINGVDTSSPFKRAVYNFAEYFTNKEKVYEPSEPSEHAKCFFSDAAIIHARNCEQNLDYCASHSSCGNVKEYSNS